jgi:hypothetical protein
LLLPDVYLFLLFISLELMRFFCISGLLLEVLHLVRVHKHERLTHIRITIRVLVLKLRLFILFSGIAKNMHVSRVGKTRLRLQPCLRLLLSLSFIGIVLKFTLRLRLWCVAILLLLLYLIQSVFLFWIWRLMVCVQLLNSLSIVTFSLTKFASIW